MKEAQILSEKGEDMKQATDHLISLSKNQKLSLYKEGLWREKADRHVRDDYVRKEGIEQGIEQGMQKGRQEGIEQGMQKRDREVVLNMFQNNMDMSLICKVTGLSPEEIKKLQNGETNRT